ncbi:MIP family Ig-specific serine endopeptidase [Mycoplasma parvum]|uniref:DUF31 domain-containing protein n=1 Tax=Mycoplasma parvum str. Indiana TaxID=1403316 RepID=U5NFI9_9MOLU|nr:hypothetical protein [Mycoplasma parvum]AGX88914.1 hypothetical protein PRV_00740 [Mycoplasma parvum str. Indiana]
MGNLVKVVLSLCGVSGCYPLAKYFLLKNNGINDYFKNKEDANAKTFETRTKEEQEFLQQVLGGGGDNKVETESYSLVQKDRIFDYPYQNENLLYEKFPAEEVEKNKAYREFWQPHNFERKNWDSTKSEQIEQKIRDYTVALKHRCSCAAGTGWILDYEWPEDGTYPTKWFIATNAHVFERFNFSDTKEDNFGQVLPQSCTLVKASPNSFQLGVFKETVDENQNKKLEGVNVKSTKLFYSARNHLGDSVIKSSVSSDDYFHDFIVLEVVFNDQYDAKMATDDFHGKYGIGNKKPINLFHNGITESEENFFKEKTYNTAYYVGGFPKLRGDFMTFNHKVNEFKHKAATLSQKTLHFDLQRRDEGKRALRGIEDSPFSMSWGKTKKQDITGFYYWIDRINIGAGGSGAMVVDENENLLGLYSLAWTWEEDLGGVQPIRSHSLDLSKDRKTPKFDLIRGIKDSGGQTSSYKSQLDKYYEGKKTFLREKQSEQFNSSF